MDILTDPHRRHLALTLAVGAGLAMYLSGSLPTVAGLDLALVLALGGGFPIYLEALRHLLRRRISADLAVSLAAIAAITIGQYLVAAEVIFIMLIGESLENLAVGKTRAGIASLLALRPEEARIRRGGEEKVVSSEEILMEDTVLVRPGDRIPIDGRVLRGNSAVDQSPITGESIPADKTVGDPVYAGTINVHGFLELEVENLPEYTTLAKIIHLVEHAEASRAPAQRLADRYAVWFVPLVLTAAILTLFVSRDLVRAVAVLVVACPCALVLATPTAVAAAIGGLVRRGVLVKGGEAMERLGRIETVIFDKTGTLTRAKLQVARVITARGQDKASVLELAAAVERYSEHPVGAAIAEEARRQGVDARSGSAFRAHPGLGAEARVGGSRVFVGNESFIRENGIPLPTLFTDETRHAADEGFTLVIVAREASVVGAVAIRDTVRPEARETVARLERLGVRRIVMLTGDHQAAADTVAREAGITEVVSELLPDSKAEQVRTCSRVSGPVAMVGDGINDAPSLVTADVGIAMADIGSDVAIESADVVLMGADLLKLPYAVARGRHMLRIIWQNILGFALVFNVAAVTVASLGWISPVVAAVTHQISSLTVILNSLRLMMDWHIPVMKARKWFESLREHRRRVLALGSAALVVVWWLSGVYVVRIGETAVVQHFGRVVGETQPPGLHYRLPWPLGRHTLVSVTRRRRVEVGFRTLAGTSEEPPAYEWNVQHRSGRRERRVEESLVLTGDENLGDVNCIAHYRISDPVRALFRTGRSAPGAEDRWDVFVRNAVEAALRLELTHRPADDLLASARRDLEEAVSRQASAILGHCDSGLSIEAVFLGDVHPPLAVVPAFREVTSAREEKEARINDAEAYQYETEAFSRGRADELLRITEGEAIKRVQNAQGSAIRFEALVEVSRIAWSVTRLRLWIGSVEQILENRGKFILDHGAEGAPRRLFLGGQDVWRVTPPPESERMSEANSSSESTDQ